ncbi:chorismate-binding protein [Dactylosporangium matsuzakiense]|uniref:chorismate-binding protein n=1 Tax=Dactylosporangium matsuzakiense TaxID=53360 RepID=UPI0022030A2B|nr:chorismate-binding protein [Dactylosporangium matsuzakiense]
MSTLGPVVGYAPETVDLHPPGLPDACKNHVWERSRIEWYAADGGDPLRLLIEFAESHGVQISDLSASPTVTDPFTCGISVLLSPPSVTPSPTPSVPDLVAVAYSHGPRPRHAPPLDGDRTVGNRTPRQSEAARNFQVPAHSAGARGAGARPDKSREARHFGVGPWIGSWTEAEHAAAVEAVRAAIARGDVYVVNLVGHASAPIFSTHAASGRPALAVDAGDLAAALARVAALPGARYGGVLRGNDWWVATASPETLISVAAGRAVTRPIKGTRPATPAGRAELLSSAKERAEHVMIVDLERNDLGRVAAVGTVRVDELFALRRWSGLWQAESTVSARLAPGVGLAELLTAVWPGGSVTGAPKRAAIAVATALEPVGRGPSMGACGWIGHDRAGRIEIDLGLTIRTVAVTAGRAHLWAGGGIVWDSDPAAEVAEAAAKMAPIKRALHPG